MGYKKLVTLVCDGPCGTALENQTHTPEKWHKLMLQEKTGTLQQGQQAPRPLQAYLCPACFPRLLALLSRNGYSLDGGTPAALAAAGEGR